MLGKKLGIKKYFTINLIISQNENSQLLHGS